MRALTIAGRGAAPAVADLPVSHLDAGQVRVAVEAASVNGIDVAAAAGYLWDRMPHEFPVVLGRDFAGTVDSVGSDVTRWKSGDRVAGVITAMALGSGAICEVVNADATVLVAVPAGLSALDAAAVGLAGVAATDLIVALGLTADDVVLVSGASGGVGAFAVQLAARAGAKVIATARGGDAARFVRDLGAAEVVDHTEGLAAQVRAAAPEGLTAVIHAAGDPAQLAALLISGGRLASVVGATPEQVGRADVTTTPVLAVATPDKLSGLLEAAASGALRVPVARTYRLDEAPQAISDFASPKLGKLVIAIR